MGRCLRSLGIVTLLGLVAAAPRPRDPWVLRCVLDGNPRMTLLALADNVWASYDTAECTLHKLWVGDVDFTGSVWDEIHGPQPVSRGEQLVHGPVDRRFTVRRDGIEIECRPLWRGYIIENGRVHLLYELVAGHAHVRLSESPEVFVTDGTIRFERRFHVSEAPRGHLVSVSIRARENGTQLELRHDGEPADDAQGQQFYEVLLPAGREVVIDAIFQHEGTTP